jgi:nitric oxide reductase large subunit
MLSVDVGCKEKSMTTQEQPVDRCERRMRRGNGQLLVVNIVGLCLIIYATVNVLPRFASIFDAMLGNRPLPYLTAGFLAIHPFLYLAVCVVALVSLVFVDRAQEDQRRLNRLHVIVLLGWICFGIVFVVAMFLPLVAMGGGLGQ